MPSLVMLIVFLLCWIAYIAVDRYDNRHNPDADFQDIQERGVLRVCGEYDPFGFFTDDNGQHGFHYEIALDFAEKYDLELKYLYEANFSTRLKLLQTGKYDIITGPLPVITELKPVLAYTEPLYTSRLMLIQLKKDNPIRNQVELAKKTVIVPLHSPNLSRLHHLATEISDSIHIREIRVFNSEELITLVSEGKADFSVMDERVAKACQHSFNTIDCKTPLGFNQFQAWAVRKNSVALLDSLNQFIISYKKSPAYTRLLRKY